MSSLFKAPQVNIPAPIPPPLMPNPNDPVTLAAEKAKLTAMNGRSSTILTRPGSSTLAGAGPGGGTSLGAMPSYSSGKLG
jgi:hypothetical protein